MNAGGVPSPDFDSRRYQRPNHKWICGHAGEGCPCRLGPTPSGNCRTTAECQPHAIVRADGTKTWKCTRPKEYGGACETGPRPDGTCCRPVAPCKPVRSLRARRGLLTRVTIAASIGILLIGFSVGTRESFINPAPVSVHHSGPDFERLLARKGGNGQGCVACHVEAGQTLTTVARSAAAASTGSLTLDRIWGGHPRDFSRIDRTCINCHTEHDFHQPNVAGITTCSTCHLEHQGSQALARVPERQCTACHADATLMDTYAEQSRRMPPELFAPKTTPGLVIHPGTRPAEGFTTVIHGFATDHPDFHPVREKLRDPNTLKFNHRLHLQGDTIPSLNGKKLDCAACHQPDAAGSFMQRVTFEQSCRPCHGLNFDENTPGLQLPHGDPIAARAFLRSLPTQYADHATRQLKVTGKDQITDYVTSHLAMLRGRMLTGESLERAVFFADGRTGVAPIIAGLKGEARAKFAGCAYCHEVTPQGEAAPLITKPQAADRWFLHARFDHSRHRAVKCTDCHAAEASEHTADIILPSIKSCTECHSPKGGVGHACSTCHAYHREKPAALKPPPIGQ
jgi:hypothetical protein